MNDTIRTFMHIKQTNIQTQPEQPKQRHQRGIHYEHKVYPFTTEKTPIQEYSYSKFALNWPILYISSITNFALFIYSQNIYILGLLNNFVNFIHPYINPLPSTGLLDIKLLFLMKKFFC